MTKKLQRKSYNEVFRRMADELANQKLAPWSVSEVLFDPEECQRIAQVAHSMQRGVLAEGRTDAQDSLDEVHGLPPLERVPAVCLAREQIVCNK